MPGNRELPTDSPQAYSSESMAEAFSYLLRLFHQEVGVEQSQFRMVDDSSVFDTFYQDLLLDAARVCEYLEAEVLIDAFPYSARVKDSSVTVSADDPTLEKSIRLGYVQSDMQKMIRLRGLIDHEARNNKEILSVTSFAKTFYEKLGDVVVTLVSESVPRYTMTLPLMDELHRMFAGNGLFVEDLSSIEMLGTEDYVVPRRLWKSEGLSVADVCSYLDGETTVADFMESMRTLDRTLSFGDVALTFSSYVLDAHKLTGLSESKYPPVGSGGESTDFSTGS
ncbi:hypothetical protein DIE07_32270 [Burkholderia sp. Bp9002]|nr:hypothetical protein DIE07_32270 [Burkholderia sp. Bp9002]